MATQVDIAVLGAGPAGCVAARALARLGYRLAVIHAPRPFIAWEGVSERTRDGLARAGCARALAAIGPEVQRRAHWGGKTVAANRERIVDRARFDAALLEDLAEADIPVLRGRVGRLEVERGETQIRWRGPGNEPRTLTARLVIDARGRRTPRLGGCVEAGPETTALIRAWRVPESLAPMTAVAPFADGWAWFACDGVGRAVLQIVIDGRPGGLPRRRGLGDLYSRLVAEIEEARAWLAGAKAVGRVWARNATMRLLMPAATRRCLRIGDAAAAIDPLSGQGLFEAAGSALASVAVANTLLRRPENTEPAITFLNDRAAFTFRHQAQVARAFYAREERWVTRPFWRARAGWPASADSHDADEAATARIERRPVIADDFVVERAVVVSARHPRGVWQVAGVPVVDLLEAVRQPGATPQAAARHFGCDVEAIVTASRWLAENGLLD